MQYSEIRKNVFTVDKSYVLAHCISSDCHMGAGIAVDFQKKFRLREKLLRHGDVALKHPACIQIDRVYNLITKSRYRQIPTYESLTKTLELLRDQMIKNSHDKLAIPKIASGKDRLQWAKVREIIHEVFQDTEIEILVCHV